MRHVLGSFCHDERGSLLLTDWLFLTTILMVAIVPPVMSLWSRATDMKPRTLWMAEHK